MTIFEVTTAIGNRADQIEKATSNKHYIRDLDLSELEKLHPNINFDLNDSIKISLVEFLTRRSPLLLLKKRGDVTEVWKVREMQFPEMNNLNLKTLIR
jgi:hypothetical protein